MILKSENRSIEIIILKRSYSTNIDFEDANWLESEIKICVPGFRGLYGANLRSDDFERFYKELENLKTDRSSKVEFTTMEEGLYLKGSLDITGNVKWNGIAKSSWGNSCLTFVIETDHASIDDLLKQTHDILDEYPVTRPMN